MYNHAQRRRIHGLADAASDLQVWIELGVVLADGLVDDGYLRLAFFQKGNRLLARFKNNQILECCSLFLKIEQKLVLLGPAVDHDNFARQISFILDGKATSANVDGVGYEIRNESHFALPFRRDGPS